MIWGETGRPGYGLYDRALGATYLNGLWEAIDKMSNKQEFLFRGVLLKEVSVGKQHHMFNEIFGGELSIKI